MTRTARGRLEAARRTVEAALLAESPAEVVQLSRAAEAHADSAWRLLPTQLGELARQARYWRAAAQAVRVPHVAMREKVELAEAVARNAAALLQEEPDHPGAHHLLGVLHMELMRVGGAVRVLAGTLLGMEAVRGATWRSAERHLRRALDGDPSEGVYGLALAELLIARGREREAREVLEEISSRAGGGFLHERHAREARLILERLDGGPASGRA